MMAALGMFVFELATLAFDELQRRSDWHHPAAERAGARAASQYTGPGSDRIILPGSVYLEIADGRVSLDQLRQTADTGEAQALVDGSGTVWGSFTIISLDERHTAFLPDGTPRRIDFSIELMRVDDGEISQ